MILTIIETYFLLLGAGLVAFLFFFILFTRARKKEIRSLLERVAGNKNIRLRIASGIYDYRLEDDDITFLIKVLYVPKKSSITINSRDTWCLRYGGLNKYHYSRQCYLNSLIPFLQLKVQDNRERKIILVHPGTDKIQRYLNESEIAIVNYRDLVYDYKIITYTDFEKHFEDLR